MPKRTDIKSILIIGAGPIIIGQACEFDYSGTQACRALKEEGYRVILVNSNPATIMTDQQFADATYIEPIHWSIVSKIIAKERPDALLPTMGGQTALNCALDLACEGILEQYNVQMIGASREAIDKAENRERFRAAMNKIGLATPESYLAHNMDEAWQVLNNLKFPVIIRPSFTLGGTGGGIAYNRDEFQTICMQGLDASPTNELLIEESILGWKEFELEVVRDKNDNCIIVCSIENFDPMGIHTGDSITVAPALTLTDKEYQVLRDASIKILREIGVETGGSNVQFAVNPENGKVVVVEMNPRVSRSSALASKATGFPIAKVAAKLAVGYTLDELKNEITGGITPAAFEPTIDYIVTKIPRFDFKKFKNANDRLTTQMKSVGEVMAIGRTFQESLQKAMRSLEIGMCGFDELVDLENEESIDILQHELTSAGSDRLWYIGDAFRAGFDINHVHKLTKIDPWFLAQIKELIDIESWLKETKLNLLTNNDIFFLKQKGFSDVRLATLLHVKEKDIRKYRFKNNIHPVYKRVDTCSAEFPTTTAYMYSTYEEENESNPSNNKKIVVLGSGPNRIGQGIEFDYCCVHAALAIKAAGFEAIMINCNPETVSTDFDISDRLYFEPLTIEDVLEVIHIEKPHGVIVQFGGQTPLKLAERLAEAGVPIIGTSPLAIKHAEDREYFANLIHKLDLKQPRNGIVRSIEEGVRLAKIFSYPLIVRPSFVLGGQAMRVIYNEKELISYLKTMHNIINDDAPLLLDQFLNDAIEVDVDAICDGEEVLLGGILEHIEEAGVHSGDSSCVWPAHSLSKEIQQELLRQVTIIAKELKVIGLINAQFAIKNGEIFILEVNPRASRTVPFIAKAANLPLAKIATKCMLGISLKEQNVFYFDNVDYFAIKQAVFPFARFAGVDPLLGPEMRSTGEIMGVGKTFGEAFAKGLLASGNTIQKNPYVFISVRDNDKNAAINVAKKFIRYDFKIVATHGTAKALICSGIECITVGKLKEERPNIIDMIKNNQIAYILNTSAGKQASHDAYLIRCAAVRYKVCYSTTIAGGIAACESLAFKADDNIYKLQELG